MYILVLLVFLNVKNEKFINKVELVEFNGELVENEIVIIQNKIIYWNIIFIPLKADLSDINVSEREELSFLCFFRWSF